MYIKLKLESQSSTANSNPHNITNFFIDDDATINNLKIKIEEYVNIPAERLEIRTLTTTFQNNCLVKKVCDIKGSLLMLYDYGDDYNDDYNEYNEEPNFVCCLQLYTNEMAAKQQELEQRLKSLKTPITPTSSSSSVTLIACSDSEDSEGSATETASSKSSGSDSESTGSSSDDSDSSAGKKRSKHGKQSTQHKKAKVATTVGGQYSPTLCKYLDEFPKCAKDVKTKSNTEDTTPQIVNNSQPVETKPPSPGLSQPNKVETPKDNKTSTTINGPEKDANSKSANNSGLNKIQSNIISTTLTNIHPCYAINPEIREYVVIISKTDKNAIIHSDCQELLVWFFDRFRACDVISNLQFDCQTAVSLYEGKLWIACMDVNTFEWISASILEYNLRPYSILALKESQYLCDAVVPIVSKSKNILEIFDLLEKQNPNLTTLKWCIKSRKTLLPEEKGFEEKAISSFCTNEIFQIVMDKEGKDYLENCNFKLKYCFWYIVFNFSDL